MAQGQMNPDGLHDIQNGYTKAIRDLLAKFTNETGWIVDDIVIVRRIIRQNGAVQDFSYQVSFVLGTTMETLIYDGRNPDKA